MGSLDAGFQQALFVNNFWNFHHFVMDYLSYKIHVF